MIRKAGLQEVHGELRGDAFCLPPTARSPATARRHRSSPTTSATSVTRKGQGGASVARLDRALNDRGLRLASGQSAQTCKGVQVARRSKSSSACSNGAPVRTHGTAMRKSSVFRIVTPARRAVR